MTTLWLDLESYNEEPIKSGTYKYASTAEITLFAYAVDDGPSKVLDLTLGREEDVQKIRTLIGQADEIYAHNAMFDRTVLNYRGFLTVPEKWRCTMVQAMAHGLPGGLDQLCEIFKVKEDSRKMRDGKRLMLFFCKPRPKNVKLHRATRETHPEDWAEFMEYARLDIEAMRAVHAKLPKWNYQGVELDLWHLDQLINDRGFATDPELVDAAIAAIGRAQKILSRQAQEITDDAITATTQRDKMLQWMLEEYGFDVPDLRAATVDKLLEREIPEAVRELLVIRQQASASSTAKYAALKRGANEDNRLRGTVQFDGAMRTRRACLAGGSLVRTRDPDGRICDTPIESVRLDQEVWDGRGWVPHEGVVYSGMKEVLTYDGVTATVEHIVWLDGETKCTLQDAKTRRVPLWSGER